MNFGLRFNGFGHGWGVPRRPGSQRRVRCGAAGADGAGASTSSPTLAERVGGFGEILEAAAVGGSLSAAGSLLAQFVEAKQAQKEPVYDFSRALRLLGFGALLYGPYQHLWFSLLDWKLPARNVPNLLAKTALSQVALAPAALAFLYLWNLRADGSPSAFNDRIRHHLAPSTVDGWKIWLPAAGAAFLAVPADLKVFFVSAVTAAWANHVSPAAPAPREEEALIVLEPLPVVAPPPPPPTPAPAAAKGEPAKKKKWLSDDKVTLVLVALWIGACAALKKD